MMYTLCGSILAALDIAVLIRGESGFAPAASLPAWWPDFGEARAARFSDSELVELFPFLEAFLPEAQALWSQAAPVSELRTDIWQQDDRAGVERSFEAITLRADGEEVLLIRLLGSEYEQRKLALQRARERGLATERLERVNRAKSEFLANMSHELRTPLNAMLGFSALLLQGRAGELNPKQTEFTNHVRQAATHLLALINDVLDLTRIDAGRLELRRERFALATALGEVVPAIEGQAAQKNIRLEAGGCGDRQLFADRIRFKQILYNLLTNAVKFTPPGGRVELTSFDDAEQIWFSVKDTGIGIAPEDVEAIFYPFYQGAEAREGTGLGLTITRRFVERHGGLIRVESTPGEGSRFVFTLGSEAGGTGLPADARQEAGAASVEGMPVRSGCSIAIVEDNAANRLFFETLLEPHYRVTALGAGGGALEGFERSRPDIVLMDVSLPGMDGTALLAHLRAIRKFRDLPVVAISAHALPGDRERFLSAGFDAYVAKPVTDELVLFEAIGSAIQARLLTPETESHS